MKLPNFENWSNAELSKVPKFDFQSQFSMSKIIGIFLIFFVEECQKILFWTFFDNIKFSNPQNTIILLAQR